MTRRRSGPRLSPRRCRQERQRRGLDKRYSFSAFCVPRSAERALGRQLAEGRAAAQQLQTARDGGAPLPLAWATRLRAQAQTGEQARTRLIGACAPLVERLARQYQGFGVPRADLVQEGWLGVLRATRTFDPAKGPSFSTHAHWAARKAILDALTARSRLIRLPAGVVAALRQITAAQQQWAQTSDRPPMVGDLARLTGLAPARVQQIVALGEPPLSLDAPADRDSRSPRAAREPDPHNPDPTAWGLAAVQRQEVGAALTALDPLARQVVSWRFGLTDGVPHAVEEVATLLCLSPAEVERLEATALVTLRTALTRGSTRPDPA
jgi:RNA polymerase sigma factor (sigma-70 family)